MLSKRLSLVLETVPSVDRIADVGTDHGYLAVALIEAGKARSVIATDVNEGPLQSAVAYVRARGLEDQISCRLGDGLSTTTPGEVDVAIMCGMGGDLMQHIIETGPELLDTYVLQPQSKRKELKQFLGTLGYGVLEEHCLEEGGHYYDVWLVKRHHFDNTVYSQLHKDSLLWEFGALLQQEQSPCWTDYVKRRIEEQQKVVAHMMGRVTSETLEEAHQQLRQLEELLHGSN